MKSCMRSTALETVYPLYVSFISLLEHTDCPTGQDLEPQEILAVYFAKGFLLSQSFASVVSPEPKSKAVALIVQSSLPSATRCQGHCTCQLPIGDSLRYGRDGTLGVSLFFVDSGFGHSQKL
jgi:hypothetical protein